MAALGSYLRREPSAVLFAAQLLGPTLLIGVGLGGAFVSATQLAMHGVDDADAGLAGGLVNTGQQVGGSLDAGPLPDGGWTVRARLPL